MVWSALLDTPSVFSYDRFNAISEVIDLLTGFRHCLFFFLWEAVVKKGDLEWESRFNGKCCTRTPLPTADELRISLSEVRNQKQLDWTAAPRRAHPHPAVVAVAVALNDPATSRNRGLSEILIGLLAVINGGGVHSSSVAKEN